MQTPVLFEGTVRDNLRIRPADVRGDFSEARLAEALAEVGLDPGSSIATPSRCRAARSSA